MKKQNRQTKRMSMAVAMIVMAAMIGVSVGGRRAHAAAPMTFTVKSLADDGSAGTLRQAILDANANPGADTITFQAGLTGTIGLTQGQLETSDDLEIMGPGATSLTVSGNLFSRVFFINPEVTVTISGLTISNGNDGSDQGGGGILNQGTLTITNCTVSNNNAVVGGGISNNPLSGFGTLTISNSTVSNNSAFQGGGITNHPVGGVGTLTIINSTLSGNRAINLPVGVSSGGGVNNEGTLRIISSTLSHNTSEGSGGGISNRSSNQPLTITNSTLSENSATGGGGISDLGNNPSTVSIKNSIVANSPSGGNCPTPSNFNVFGTNFSTDSTCPGFDQVLPGELNLLPLTLNAPGTTATHALELGSVAIDAVTDCTDLSDPPSLVTTDQRGVPRIAPCDVGAYEFFQYNFSGFFHPVDNLAVNGAKAGASIAVNFSLSGDQGLGIFAAGSPASQMIPCDGGAPISEIEATDTAGHSGLSYDAGIDVYTYVWKTEKSWKGTCRQLIVTLMDGSVHTANFQFR